MDHKRTVRPLKRWFSLAAVLFPALATAQDMEPRAYSNAPVGLNILLVSYIYSSGNVLVDSSLPVEDVEAEVQIGLLAYVRTIDFFGRSGKVALLLPYAQAELTGLLAGEFASVRRTGLADPRLRLSVNFAGAPALRPREFASYRQGTIIGASLQLSAPLGQYDETKRVNLGSNRWSLRPEIGASLRLGRWIFELAASVTYFTDNHDFLETSTLDQEPISAIQGHLVYNFRPRLWAALDAVYFRGGETRIDGVRRNDLQTNTRIGLTFAVPVARRQTLKLLFASGLTTRIGADFDSIGLAYQVSWGAGTRRAGRQARD